MLAQAATNKIITDSSFPSDSGAIGSPKSSSDLAAISTMLGLIVSGKGKDKNAVKDAFIITGIQIFANHSPQALDMAGKVVMAVKMMESFISQLSELDRKSRGDELTQNFSSFLTKDVPSIVMTAGALVSDLGSLFQQGNGNFQFFSEYPYLCIGSKDLS